MKNEGLNGFIKRLKRERSVTANKIVKLLEDDEIQEVFLGYPENLESMKQIGGKKTTKIFLTKKYALHMYNSGHLTGFGSGGDGHDDRLPLRVTDVLEIMNFVKEFKISELEFSGFMRKRKRYRVTKIFNGRILCVIFEIPESGERIDIVTAFTLENSKYLSLLKQKKRDLHNRRPLLSQEQLDEPAISTPEADGLHNFSIAYISAYVMKSSILEAISRRISGSFSRSSGVNLPRTKSVSPILRRRASFAVPTRRRGKSSVPRCSIVDFRPLFPPALPFSRKRILPKSRLKSSQIINISLFLIL